MDKINNKILNIIQTNSRISNKDLAEKLGMAPSAVLMRIRKLESEGVIQRYEAKLDPRALGLDITCFVQIRTTENVGETAVGKKLSKIPEVQEVHFISGNYCYLVKVRVSDTDAFGELLKKIGSIQEVSDTSTTLVLKTIKETHSLPAV